MNKTNAIKTYPIVSLGLENCVQWHPPFCCLQPRKRSQHQAVYLENYTIVILWCIYELE